VSLQLGIAFALTSVDQPPRVVVACYAIALGAILAFATLRLFATAAPAGVALFTC